MTVSKKQALRFGSLSQKQVSYLKHALFRDFPDTAEQLHIRNDLLDRLRRIEARANKRNH